MSALAVAAPRRSALLPDVPTLEESGVKGYEADAWYGLLAPAGIAPEVSARLRRVAAEFAAAPDTVKKFEALGIEARSRCGDTFGAQLVREVRSYGELARALDLKPE